MPKFDLINLYISFFDIMCLMNNKIRSAKYENEIIIFKVNFATGGKR
jgi:hypothetical protein